MEKYGELDYAKLDFDRGKRTGYPETIFCQGKTIAQLRGILRAFWDEKINVLGTRASREQYENLKEEFPEMEYRETASASDPSKGEGCCGRGRVAVCYRRNCGYSGERKKLQSLQNSLNVKWIGSMMWGWLASIGCWRRRNVSRKQAVL